MTGTEILYSISILIVLAAAAAGLSKLKQILKRYASSACADRSAR